MQPLALRPATPSVDLACPPARATVYDFPGQAEPISRLKGLLTRVRAGGGTRAACAVAARPEWPGCSRATLYKKFRLWRDAGFDDAVLIDRRHHTELWKSAPPTLPEEFLQWVGGRMLGNQRKSKPAYRQILREWQEWRRTGNRAPNTFRGYDAPPAPGPKGHPVGWSYRQLMEKAQPPVEELNMARIGTVAAGEYLPYIVGTREGVRFLEWVFCDDVYHDRKIVVASQLEPVRLLQFGTLDYASGVYLKFGIQPDLSRDDGTRERLKRRDFLWIVACLLWEYGFPVDYVMHLVVERGTATLSRAEAQLLYELTDGHVQVGYTEMEGRFVLAWEEGKSGNPKSKGPLESWHNLFHNEQGALPGQVGKDRNHSPAALVGSDREAVALNKIGLILTDDQRRRIRSPYPSLHEGHEQATEIVRRINHRRDHDLEGFGKVNLWRFRGLDMDWQPEAKLLTLGEAELAKVEYLPVQESPWERMLKLSQGVRVARPHPGALVRFFTDSHKDTVIERLGVKVDIEGRAYWFGPETPAEALANGTPVTAHHAPLDPQYALITSGGKMVGVWKRQLVRRGDLEALAQATKRKVSFLNQTASNVRGKMAEQLLANHARVESNDRLLEEVGLTPASAARSLATGGEVVSTPVAEGLQQLTRTEGRRKSRASEDAKLSKRAEAAMAAAAERSAGETKPTNQENQNGDY